MNMLMNTTDTVQLSSPVERGKRLRILRNMSGLTIAELAAKYAIGVSTIKYWENGTSEGISSKGAKKFMMAMRNEGIYCTDVWLMHGIGMYPQFFDAQRGITLEKLKPLATTLDEEVAILNEMNIFLQQTPCAITLMIYDDAMDPYYRFGDTIGGNFLYDKDIALAVGKDCLIETADKQILCRRLISGNGDGKYTLCCLNPHTCSHLPNLYDVKVFAAAPVVRVWKRM